MTNNDKDDNNKFLYKKSKERDRDRCSVHTTHTTLHGKEKRKPIQIRMRASIHKAVGRYTGNYMTYGQFYEEAAILFMDVNPPLNSAPITVVKPIKGDQSLDDSLQEMIVKDKLDDLLERLRRIKGKIHVSNKKKFLGIVKEYQKIKNPSTEIVELMKEGRNYFQ